MRILILAPDIYTRGGIARYTSTLASVLADLIGPENVDVLPLLGTPGAEKNVPAYRIFKPVACRLSMASKFRFAFRALKLGLCGFNLVISTHIGLSPVAAMMHLLFRTPFWVTCHGSEAWPRFPTDVRWALNRASRILPVSCFTADTVARVNGIPQSKISVIYNALPDEFSERLMFSNGSNCSGAGTEHKEKCILSVGKVSRESDYKGYDTVIKVLPRVLEAVPGVRYVVVGGGDDIDRLKRLAREAGVEDRVDFKGALPDADLAECYRACDVFALPSRTVSLNGKGWQGEGFGRVYVEASLAGKPVVGSTGGGAVEAVLHLKTGLLVNPESVVDVADALIYLLQNPEEAARMGREGRSWARETFSEASLRSTLAEVLREGGHLQ
jgi:glycosyltransferase involved in cell wall biosynthesis